MSLSSAGASRYELVDCLGRGTVCEVWRAVTPGGATVALKRLRPEWAVHGSLAQALRNEYCWLERLRHPAIVSVRGWLEKSAIMGTQLGANASPAIVLEYLPGGDLVSLAGAHPGHWIDAALDLLAALEFVHSQGIVHGDVKARNALFDSADRVRLIDFSSAGLIGRPAPRRSGTLTQQRRRSGGHIMGIDDDAFAFAALLYELCTGRPPFPDDDSDRSQPPALHLKSAAADRLDSVEEMRAAIMQVLGSARADGQAHLARCKRALMSVAAQMGELDRRNS